MATTVDRQCQCDIRGCNLCEIYHSHKYAIIFGLETWDRIIGEEEHTLCLHLPQESLGTRQCNTCGGHVRLKVYQCQLGHGANNEDNGVTISQSFPLGCKGCPDYSPRSPTQDEGASYVLRGIEEERRIQEGEATTTDRPSEEEESLRREREHSGPRSDLRGRSSRVPPRDHEMAVSESQEGNHIQGSVCNPDEIGIPQAIREQFTGVSGRQLRDLKWIYGVTTCHKRIDTLLPVTIRSLKSAGFQNPYIFVDGCDYDSSLLSHHLHISRDKVIIRNEKITPFANWILSAWELWLRNPNADRYAIFQDDILCVSNLKKYLDNISYPKDGYLNLYAAMHNEVVFTHRWNVGDKIRKGEEWYRGSKLRSGPEGYQKGLGALALVFSRDSFINLLSQQSLLLKPLCADKKRAWKCIDGGIVEAMNHSGWYEYIHNPGLVQHNGLGQTTLGNQSMKGISNTWPGEEFDALSLLE